MSGNRFVKEGSWDSIHVVEVIQDNARKATYKLTTTVMLSMAVQKVRFSLLLSLAIGKCHHQCADIVVAAFLCFCAA